NTCGSTWIASPARHSSRRSASREQSPNKNRICRLLNRASDTCPPQVAKMSALRRRNTSPSRRQEGKRPYVRWVQREDVFGPLDALSASLARLLHASEHA